MEEIFYVRLDELVLVLLEFKVVPFTLVGLLVVLLVEFVDFVVLGCIFVTLIGKSAPHKSPHCPPF